MINVDLVLGLSRGDEGKGKVCHSLLENGDYTHCLRYSGGGNAGHTIYHKGTKFVTHLVPAGVFYNKPAIIGAGCVINETKLLEEIASLEAKGIPVEKNLKIAYNAHIVTQEHLALDNKDSTIGTTKTGNGPCYQDKYARVGKRAENCPQLTKYVIDIFDYFYQNENNSTILAEGAQGFYLDIDWGEYPFVTSSHCGIGGLIQNGFNHKQIRNVIGIAKAYDTYVGLMEFEPPQYKEIFSKIRELGEEFGATTGRPRQCDWLNLDELTQAILMNGVESVIINKIDILDKIKIWKCVNDSVLYNFTSSTAFRNYVIKTLKRRAKIDNIKFSDNPYNIM